MCYRCPNSQPFLTSCRRFSGLGRRRSSFRSHPHLLPRPYPCPLSAPWRATSAPLVVAACGHGEERNREVSWRVWTTGRLLCACSVFALSPCEHFFSARMLFLPERVRVRGAFPPAAHETPLDCAQKPVGQRRPGPLFDASTPLRWRLACRRSDKARLAFNWPHRP